MVIILNGSPNVDGNCGFISLKAKQIIEKNGLEAKIINVVEVLKDMEFPFCTACGSPCPQVCESKSKKLKEALDILRESKGLIMVSPVYFGSLTGELKAFMDLARHLRNEKIFYNGVGAAVSVGATKYGGQETTVKTMHDIMLIQGMIVVGNSFSENMGHQGTCFHKPAKDDEVGIESLTRTCNRVAELVEKLNK